MRPLQPELRRCAAADVLYLIALMEAQSTAIRAAAASVANSLDAGRLRAPGSPGSNLPFDRDVLMALAGRPTAGGTAAGGAGGGSSGAVVGLRGCLAWARLGSTFQQDPLQVRGWDWGGGRGVWSMRSDGGWGSAVGVQQGWQLGYIHLAQGLVAACGSRECSGTNSWGYWWWAAWPGPGWGPPSNKTPWR